MKGFMRTWRGLAGKSATEMLVSSEESARAVNAETGWVLSEAAERPRTRLKCSGRFSALRLQFGGPVEFARTHPVLRLPNAYKSIAL
jgi:hypothetical protein